MTTERCPACAIFDLGSARTKLLTASGGDGNVVFRRYKEETGLSLGLTDNIEISPTTEQSLVEALYRLREMALGDGCRTSLAVATDVFRTARNAPAMQSRLERLTGPISILSPAVEGLIFLRGIETVLLTDQRLCVIDVGGGSVQIAWGHGEDEVVSLPIGTFRLEKLFHLGRLPLPRDYAAMREHVDLTIRDALPNRLEAPTLVFGSNCMLEFVSSALQACGCGSLELRGNVSGTSPAVLRALLNSVEGRPYDELADYYPNNPIFMRGADKALIVVLSLATAIRSTLLIPTDESVSTSLARIALRGAGDLAAYGLELAPLKPFK